jgi:hypothetical protein
MQVKPSSVSVKGPTEEVVVFENPTVLMGDYGLWVKTEGKDSNLSLYTWERVVQIDFSGEEEVKKVWEEAVLNVFEDLLDDFDDYELPTEETPTDTPEPKTTSTTPESADDPTSNPYE